MSRSEMNPNRPTLTLRVVSSLDGFIAKNDNSVSWMGSPCDVYGEGVSEDSAVDDFKPIDCFVLCSRTYEHALELGRPYGDTPTKPKTAVEEEERGDVRPELSQIWLSGRNLIDDCTGCIG